MRTMINLVNVDGQLIAASYTLRGNYFTLTSYRWCIDGVRWTWWWTRVRNYGTRKMRRWSRAGVPMTIRKQPKQQVAA